MNLMLSTRTTIIMALCLLFAFNAYANDTNPALSSYEEEKSKAIAVFAALEQSNNYSDELTMADLNNLPMGLSRTLSNIEYTLAVSGFVIHPDYTELSIYGKVVIPNVKEESSSELIIKGMEKESSDLVLFFGGTGIRFSHEGNFIGEAKLMLLEDITIPINGDRAALILRGGYDRGTGRGYDLTYLTLDCKGFKELGITADIIFPETLIRRVNENGDVLTGIDANGYPAEKVTASFHTIVKDFNDILVSITLPRFEIVGLNGFIFDINQAVFDFSDYHNETGVVFPGNYAREYLASGKPELWRGVYIKNLSVTLPKQFAQRDSDKRLSFSAQDMLLDNNGITGLFTASNIISIDKGSAGGWRFSVDKFSLELEANQLTGAGFAGSIGLPVSESTALAYDAFISPNNEYYLKVSPEKAINFDIWSAKAEILPNSYVEFKVVDDKFYPEAMLNGSLTIAARSEKNAADTTAKSMAQLKGIEFRKLHLRTQSPYFTVEYFGYSGEVKLMNFPLSISKIALTANDYEAKLGFDAKLALGGDKFGITAETRLEVVGSMAESKGLQNWKYKKVDVSRIAINASMAEVFTIKGGLTILDDDPTYGDGFAGDIELTMNKVLEGLTAKSRAIFGNKSYRYWFVDGSVSFGTSIPVFPPVNLTGFGGGAYYHMRPAGTGSGTPTGSAYVPDNNWGFGLKAAVLMNIGKKGVIDAEASFEIAFNTNGGINFIGFFGMAKLLAEIPGVKNAGDFVNSKFQQVANLEASFLDINSTNYSSQLQTLQKLKIYDPDKAAADLFPKSENLGEAGFAASMAIQYDFTKNSLHSTFEMYVNMLGGMLRGVNPGNSAGMAVLHIDPNEWYMHVGTPDRRLGIEFNLANLIKMKTGAYFMVGHKIPATPAPPQQVSNILGIDASKLDYMRDLNALGDGRGFAFGSDFAVSTGDITFLILYANFAAGLGFDIMLKDYGDAQCKGRSGPIGMDGWYANGQAYAYLQGELGVKVNLLFIKKKIPIIKGAAATLMQAKLPNPAWFVGYLGVKFELLGGLVKGSIRLKLALGEECELVIPGGSPLGVRVINDLSPQDKSDKVDVFAVPQAAFNMAIGKAFEMEDDSGVKLYRLNLEELSVYDNNTPLQGKITWNSNMDAASFYSHEILPPDVSLRALVRVSFEEYQNGRWATVYTGGQKAIESMEATFSTGTAPDVIPMHNIEYCYPVVDQHHFYPKEATNAYIQLKRGQSYLFSSDMTHKIHIIDKNGNVQEVPFTYSSSNNRADYSMPAVSTGSSYSFDMLSFAKGSTTSTSGTEQRTSIGDDENDITVRDAQASQVIRSDTGRSLLAYNFTSSKYNTFSEKIQNIKRGQTSWERMASDVLQLYACVASGEPFDIAELAGTSYTGDKPLVEAYATLADDYFKSHINPTIYAPYAAAKMKITNRDISILGVPPVKALPIQVAYLTEVESGIFNGAAKVTFPYSYNLPWLYRKDFYDLQHQAVNSYINLGVLVPLINGYFPVILYGPYAIELQYILPGNVEGTKASFEFFNNFGGGR